MDVKKDMHWYVDSIPEFPGSYMKMAAKFIAKQ